MMSAVQGPGRGADQGFSVMELLVALVILGFVMGMIPRTLQLASRALRAADVVDARSAEAISVDFLTSRLAQAMPVYRRSSDGLLAMAFTGGPRELSFVAPLAAGKDASGLAVFTLKSEESGEGDAAPKGVDLSWQIFRADVNPDHPAPPVHRREILPSSEGFGFRYRGRKSAPQPQAFGGEEAKELEGSRLGEWQAEWTNREQLPNEVEMTYKSVSGRLHTRIVDMKLVLQR